MRVVTLLTSLTPLFYLSVRSMMSPPPPPSINEAKNRAEHIDPALKAAGWGVVMGNRIRREYPITTGRLKGNGKKGKALTADYVLEYRNTKLAVNEAKTWDLPLTEGAVQAKNYAGKLSLRHAYRTKGQSIYAMDMQTGVEKEIPAYPTPAELWAMTFIAFQLAWKLFHSRWNRSGDPPRRPRIHFLADRNILANQAYNVFSAFPVDALVRIEPGEIKKKGKVPKNGNLFFTIFQTFPSGPMATAYFGAYPADFFDFIGIDECHRGGVNDESTWRDILNYFSPAAQLGLTATPKRKDNVDTYAFFGEPVFVYSLKEGINDGFLTPFRVKQISTTLDEYICTPDDVVMEGEVEAGKLYGESDFNRKLEIQTREQKRVDIFMSQIDQTQKTLVFCASQEHALLVRDLINKVKTSKEPNYCHRLTVNDGALGEQWLRDFQDNEKSNPTILR